MLYKCGQEKVLEIDERGFQFLYCISSFAVILYRSGTEQALELSFLQAEFLYLYTLGSWPIQANTITQKIMKLIATANTFLKAHPADIKQIEAQGLPDQLVSIDKETELKIVENLFYEGDRNTQSDNHILIELAQPFADQSNLRWFVESASVRIESSELKDEPEPSTRGANYGKKIQLPGISRLVGINEPVYHEPEASHFTWRELTKGGTRIPVDSTITLRIVKLCKYMDGVRSFLGDKPITINSGYRDPKSNKAVKGASNSRHLYGDAVDFWVEGMDVEETFQRLKKYHRKGGLAVGKGFVHLDLRPTDRLVTWTY